VLSVFSISKQPSWMDPILSYLKDNKLPKDKKEANMIKRKAPKYWVSKEGLLYRRSFTEPSLQQYAYLVTKSSDKIFFCRPIFILGDKIFYLSPNINLRRQNLYFVATFQNINYIG
jgi:hypothetical protein